jgi:alpha-glucosidase
LPFTRNAFDPMDFTPVCFTEVPNIKRVTTNGFELALSVIFTSGIQHFAQTPEGMAAVPDYVKDFMREIPSRWDDTHFIDGYPGKLVVLARKFDNNWFIAGINGEDIEKKINLDLSFLKNTKTATLVTDGSDNRSFNMRKVTIIPDKPLEVKLKGNGGFVMKIGK